MLIKWNGHSCFTVKTQEGTVVFDPYAPGSVPGCGTLHLQADAVYCSHGHHDHAARDRVTLSGRDISLTVEALPSFHDDQGGRLRGSNTVHILHAEGMRLAHLGDLGHLPAGSLLEALQGVDALLVPVGGYYTIDAETAKKIVDAVSPRVTIPMHYRLGGMGYDVLQTLEEFTNLCGEVTYYDTDTLELAAETGTQIAVLRCVHE